MDNGTFVGIMLALFFGGFGFAYGAYEMQANHPVIAILSYCFGTACVCASIVLSFLRFSAEPTTEHGHATIPYAPKSPITNFSLQNIPPDADHPLSVSIFELTDIYEQHLTHQAEKLLEPYMGMRLTVMGTVFDVREREPRDGQTTVSAKVFRSDDKREHRYARFRFDANWKDRVLILKKDASIAVTGELVDIDIMTATFDHCKLVDANV